MKRYEAKVGTRVRTLRAWSGVPIGTEGVIVDTYTLDDRMGWVIAWEPLPPYADVSELTFENMPAVQHGSPIRDGFCEEELVTLEVIG